MRGIYHTCLSSHDEVMARSVDDINYDFNSYICACLETDSRPIADSEMTTHEHFGTATDSPKVLMERKRYMYSRHFNAKYHRKGRLGERNPFILEVSGVLHLQALLSYIFRQGLHHGLSETPFGYPHNSVNAIFQKALGRVVPTDLLDRKHMGKHLPFPVCDIPSNYRMTSGGLLLREDAIDTTYVEEIYISPRTFLYHMNRLSDEKWKQEQMADNNGLPPVTLDIIEPSCYQNSMAQLMKNETFRSYRDHITDLELCNIIDNVYIPRRNVMSVYDLSASGRNTLANSIYSDFGNGKISKLLGRPSGRANIAQIRRCAATNY